MIYHCIRFTLKPGVSDEEKAAGLAQMGEHVNAIPAIKARVVGPDFGGGFDYGAVTVLEDIEGYEQYMNHPAHLADVPDVAELVAGLGEYTGSAAPGSCRFII
ncbi:Dabb family protein [Amycolatopsis japonica]|uniref:Dabb family protein n=1 Tax=Amycolatopsis japonica TaxID=208439 RepID=UPI00332CB4C7